MTILHYKLFFNYKFQMCSLTNSSTQGHTHTLNFKAFIMFEYEWDAKMKSDLGTSLYT